MIENISKPQNKSKKNWPKWLAIVFILLASLVAYEYYKFETNSRMSRDNMRIQQEKMLDFWKSEGLTQEQIDQKLKDLRGQFVGNENPSIFQSVFRTVRHATGTGPGTGMR
jgi:hypothetical protein